jgi:methionyl-tRNA formyltransferase
MKFVFLGAGIIAKLFLEKQQREFGGALELVGIIAPENILGFYRGQDGFLSRVAFLPLNFVNRQEAALQELLKAVKPDFVLSVQYPWILSPKVLDLVRGRVLNLHNAKLPQYRGHNTISHEILNREQVHTSTLHWIAEEVDRGRIVLTRDIAIAPDDTAFSLWRRSVESAIALLAQFLKHCETIVNEQGGQPVDPGGFYYSKTDIQELKNIPNNASLEDIDRIARAFWFPPHEPAYFLKGNRRLYVLPGAYEYSIKIADL